MSRGSDRWSGANGWFIHYAVKQSCTLFLMVGITCPTPVKCMLMQNGHFSMAVKSDAVETFLKQESSNIHISIDSWILLPTVNNRWHTRQQVPSKMGGTNHHYVIVVRLHEKITGQLNIPDFPQALDLVPLEDWEQLQVLLTSSCGLQVWRHATTKHWHRAWHSLVPCPFLFPSRPLGPVEVECVFPVWGSSLLRGGLRQRLNPPGAWLTTSGIDQS